MRHEVDGIALDTGTYKVWVLGEEKKVGARMFRALAAFVSHPERAYSRTQLVDIVYEDNMEVTERDRLIDGRVADVRRLIKGTGWVIVNVYGFGYRMQRDRK